MKRISTLVTVLLLMPVLALSQTTEQRNKPTISALDEVAPFSEGLAAVRKGNQWGFINEKGTLVIDFRDDLHWKKDADNSKSDVRGVRYPMFREGLCMITKKVEDGVPLYGFMDTSGNTVIEPKFLNVYPFKDGQTTGVLFEKVLRGKNEFKLNIYDFKFFDVLVNANGDMEEYFGPRQNIQMTVKRYKLPFIGAKKISDNLVAVHIKDKGWEIRNLHQVKESKDKTEG